MKLLRHIVTASLIIISLIVVGIVVYSFKTPAATQQAAKEQSGFTIEQVSTHHTEHDCWMIIAHNVYNVSDFAIQHPGGKEGILAFCGKDATSAFATKGNQGVDHSPNAKELLKSFLVGKLQ